MAKIFKGITLKRKREDNNYYINSETYYYYYAFNKFTSRPYKGHIKLNKFKLNLIYSEVIGFINLNNFNKIRYYILFRDDFLKIFKVYFIIYKFKVFEKFRRFKIKYERNKRKIKRF